MSTAEGRAAPEPLKDGTPRHLSLVALEALANYKTAGLVHEGDTMHERLARRLARVAAKNDWRA